MRIESLTIEQVRLLERVELEPAAGINLLVGANGAGKTSILEAIHLLSSGRSFRGGSNDVLIRRGESELRVVATLMAEREERIVRLGLARGARAWNARLDGEPVEQLSRLFRELAVVCFEPDSHVLVSGSSEHRRRFIDWSLFHVEPGFIGPWRRYQRALKQRNALLKQAPSDSGLAPWETELAEHGARIDQFRADWMESFLPTLATMTRRLLPELGEVRLRFQRGWSGGEDAASLRAALREARVREQNLGHTTVGAHRSDWSVGFEDVPVREMLSRGQEKLVVLSCLLAQASAFASVRREWPVLLLDDLPSELDASHLEVTMEWLTDVAAQVFISMTARGFLPEARGREHRVFHVERGQLERLV